MLVRLLPHVHICEEHIFLVNNLLDRLVNKKQKSEIQPSATKIKPFQHRSHVAHTHSIDAFNSGFGRRLSYQHFPVFINLRPYRGGEGLRDVQSNMRKCLRQQAVPQNENRAGAAENGIFQGHHDSRWEIAENFRILRRIHHGSQRQASDDRRCHEVLSETQKFVD